MSLEHSPARLRRPVGGREPNPTSTVLLQDCDTVVWGAAAIGRVICITNARKVYHLLHSGKLGGAVKKVGAQWVGSKRKLRALVGSE
jgi:hypothetical protein